MTQEAQAVASAGVSATSAGASFFVATMPYLQWGAALVAIIAGIFAIAVSIKKLRR